MDECKQTNRTVKCSQYCTNEAGGYKCSCEDGYFLYDGDNTTISRFEAKTAIVSHTCYGKFLSLCSEKTSGDHPFSTYRKLSEKLTFVTPWYAHARMSIRGLEMLFFGNDPLVSFRSSHPGVFCKKRILKNFKKFTEKHLHDGDSCKPRACNFIKKETPTQVFYKFCEILKNTINRLTIILSHSSWKIYEKFKDAIKQVVNLNKFGIQNRGTLK